jgi:phosphoribosylaminoimidazolecarboxamide formyltransferase/IMP cyclohydrolase
MAKIQRALLSVTDKSGIAAFARQLRELGVELISTGGTAKLLRDSGIEVKDVSDVTGFPEMLDGRVKTMHPRITGGILAVRGNGEHVRALQEHGIQPIDMVVVNLYQFEKAAAKAGVTLD